MSTLYLCGAGNPEGIRLAQRIQAAQGRWDRLVVLDDDPARHGESILGVEIAGPLALLGSADRRCAEAASLVARTTTRRWLAQRKIEAYGVPFAALISPTVDTEGAELGGDIIVYQNAIIGPQVSIGEGSVVFMGAVVGHESRLGRGCIVAPNAVLNARVQLGEGAYVGTNATILPEVKVGPWATIGAGSVATRNVPAGATLIGVPGRVALTLELKLRIGEFQALPAAIRRELESHVRASSAAANRSPGRLEGAVV